MQGRTNLYVWRNKRALPFQLSSQEIQLLFFIPLTINTKIQVRCDGIKCFCVSTRFLQQRTTLPKLL